MITEHFEILTIDGEIKLEKEQEDQKKIDL